MLAEAVRYLKFKLEFVIIGRGCKDYVPLVLNFLVLIRHPCVLIVSE